MWKCLMLEQKMHLKWEKNEFTRNSILMQLYHTSIQFNSCRAITVITSYALHPIDTMFLLSFPRKKHVQLKKKISIRIKRQSNDFWFKMGVVNLGFEWMKSIYSFEFCFFGSLTKRFLSLNFSRFCLNEQTQWIFKCHTNLNKKKIPFFSRIFLQWLRYLWYFVFSNKQKSNKILLALKLIFSG